MTAPFRATCSVALVARVTMTVSRAVVFTDVRCPSCQRRVMAIPGKPTLDVRVVQSDADRSGRGRVISCKRCSALLDVIEHWPAR